MCGITGVLSTAEINVRFDALHRSVEALSHRGPDNLGVFKDEKYGIGLGHTRLSILDPSSLGNQPMTSDDGQVVLVYNGEIYNFQNLRIELEQTGVSFQGKSDTEVLLQLYLAQDDNFESMLRRLNGIFAFAIWDYRKQKLLVARDALGVKPLYIAELDGLFAFSSEIKALIPLLPSPPKGDDLDLQSLYYYATFLWSPGAGTPLKYIRKLEPGETIVVESGFVKKRAKWYCLPQFRGVRPDLDKQNSIQGTIEHLRSAVHRQMISDVPVGAFLSGGLDSSGVVAFAREVNPEICCFTISIPGGVGDDGLTDDLPYAHQVAKHLGVKLEEVQVNSSDMVAALESMIGQLDEPLADAAPLNVLFISQVARKFGIKVLLSGNGGDDLFTGYRRHFALATERYWTWLPQPTKFKLAKLISRMDARKALGRRLKKLFNGVSLPPDQRLANYFVWTQKEDLYPLLSQEFRMTLDETSTTEPLLDFIESLPADVSRIESMLALEQRFFLSDHNLIYTDKMSMAVGVEVRVPFLDLDLVEFAARIPHKFKQRGTVGKWVLKKALEPYLPRNVIYRPKTGFGVPMRRWISEELSELMADLLSEESLKRRGLFDPRAVYNLRLSNDNGQIDGSYTLFSLICIELWCRKFLDG